MSIKKALCRVGIILAVASAVAVGQTKGSVASVKIENLTWTKQNINIEAPHSKCYANEPENCKKYGRLYTWEAANKVCQDMGGGWRLPTQEEWVGLIKLAGGKEVAGKKLKAKSGWDKCDRYNDICVDNGNGTDDYGFSALPGGTSADEYDNVGNTGFFWSATEYPPKYAKNKAYRYYVSTTNDKVNESYTDMGQGYSVRCVRD